MASWRWLEMHPTTSEEAERLARRAVFSTLAIGVLTLVGSLALAFLSGGDGFGSMLIGGLFVAFGAASALVHRETYHRLRSEGK